MAADTGDEDGELATAGTTVELLEGAWDRMRCRPAVTRGGSVVVVCDGNARPTDSGEWSAKECRTPLDAVKPGEPFRQLGVYANMRGDCRQQLNHIK